MIKNPTITLMLTPRSPTLNRVGLILQKLEAELGLNTKAVYDPSEVRSYIKFEVTEVKKLYQVEVKPRLINMILILSQFYDLQISTSIIVRPKL